MLKKIESWLEQIGKYSFEHVYATSATSMILGALISVLQIIYYSRRIGLMHKSK
jgi:hypothetical protein